MDPLVLILIFVTAAIVLLIGELLLPTHGVLGIGGLVCLAGAIIVCFRINQWLGLCVFVGTMILSPFVLNLSMKLWAMSPVGRRIILQPINVAQAPSPVRIGQVGRAVTELRPMGECEFGDFRLEVVSELGIIPAGKRVKVVAVEHGRPTVRGVEQPQKETV